jgi:hypothetical protein
MPLQKRKRSHKNTVINQAKKHTPTTLLILLAEIRNRINSYAFTFLSGLLLKWTAGASRRNKKPIIVLPSREGEKNSANQLKFANKQLYRETAGLELQFNTVTFEDYNTESTSLHLFKFARFCTPIRLA